MKRKILYFLLIVFAIIQFKGIDKTNPDSTKSDDFFAVNKAPEATEALIRTACYDCHSHESVYPWYSNIAPVSWWLGDHIEEARKHLNFSTWNQLTADKKDHKLEECIEMVEGKEMPMLPYMIAHTDAWLSQEDRDGLVSFFSSIR
jgi:hypothetical protein